ncbi:hypothetical protein NQ314_006349 [Rhamnusium bicolor]|uniref:Uncharacterized protein n=1 Tax=Rhamnusium bicolor TaxID=1586634 RepID=A0AAV8Z482_9CUCU|nr:hypothetical protein NQ314_006349 [Rhamnusium bicolor]
MVFDFNGKVALITGGASGIGFAFAKELLRNGLKGLTIADLDANLGKAALLQIEEEFDAFKSTVEKFQNVDILINNAGILNDSVWEREVSTNLNGVIHGPEAVILNVSSTCGVEGYSHIPVYCATKFAIIGMTKSWGTSYHYERTNVRVVAICPGVTETPLIANMSGRNLGEPYQKYFANNSTGWLRQEPDYLAKEGIKIIKAGPPGTLWLVEGGEPAYEFVIPEREKIEKKYLNV